MYKIKWTFHLTSGQTLPVECEYATKEGFTEASELIQTLQLRVGADPAHFACRIPSVAFQTKKGLFQVAVTSIAAFFVSLEVPHAEVD